MIYLKLENPIIINKNELDKTYNVINIIEGNEIKLIFDDYHIDKNLGYGIQQWIIYKGTIKNELIYIDEIETNSHIALTKTNKELLMNFFVNKLYEVFNIKI